jgi:uncharacterized membrane protein
MRLIPRFSGATWAVLLALTLAVGGVTHGAAILLLPWRSHRDAFARVAALGPVGIKLTLPAADAPSDTIPSREPAFITAVCRYDLRAQPFRVSITPFDDGFVTLGFHSRHGLGFYGLTVRAADASRLDLKLVVRDQGQKPGSDVSDHGVRVEAPEPEGFVLLATPAENSDEAGARDRLAAFQCRSDASSP